MKERQGTLFRAAQGITGEDYDEKLAVGLFYLAVTPSPELIKSIKGGFNNFSKELKSLGLGKYRDYLRKNGGFCLVEEAHPEEYTALEAIQKSQGNCTERSTILFAIFSMAGLRPKFVQVPRGVFLKSGDSSLQQYVKALPSGSSHMCIGLQLKERFRLFDPSLFNSDAAYNDYTPLTLRQELSSYYSNRGGTMAEKGDWDQAIADYTEAIRIDPQYTQAYKNREIALAEKEKQKK